jgi:hypothetical protein
MMFITVVAAVAIVAGGIASVAGFGIASVLTPLLASQADTKLAVAAVSIPHVIGTATRFWLMRHAVDWRVLKRFGVFSAVGGLAGALLHNWASSPALTILFGILLVVAGLSELTGLARRVRFEGWSAWVAGAVSGMFGGLVGNQGGIRSAALLGFDVPRDSFVATATAIGLLVDIARVPVYLATETAGLLVMRTLIVMATVGVLFGTLLGARVLGLIPEKMFRPLVSALIVALGVYMLWRGGA